MINELIHNVASVFSIGEGTVLNGNFKKYYVPLYQRGYKWTKTQITKLLTDIDTFEYHSGKFYCVQNITLVPNLENNCYNVVDGQQRLTTMTLLLSALGERELVRHKLLFPKNSIREFTNRFIDDWIISGETLPKSWNDLIASNSDYDHQDIFHLFSGYHIIQDWLSDKNVDKVAFLEKLLLHVKFICNVIEGEKEEKIFGNLNSKRIYLDGADLVRAILITRVTKESAQEESVKNIVRINERRVRIGWELDYINRWWNQKDVQDYFRPFIQIKTGGDIQFDLEHHAINQLIALYGSSKGWGELSLEKIEQTKNTVQLYHELQGLHEELVEWFTHKEIYHYLGFLYHQSGNKPNFKNLLSYWRNESKTKKRFSAYLLAQIKDDLFGEDNVEQIFSTEENWYNDGRLVPILLFLDIIEALKDNRNRLHVKAFLKKENDVEHIYPQNPSNQKDKIGYVKYLLSSNPKVKEDALLKHKKIDDLKEEKLDHLINTYAENVSTHAIGNLVLLYYKLNRSIQNKSYSYKRQRILSYYNEGNYIQPHTLKVFSRYFLDGDTEQNDGKFWTQSDINQNEDHMKQTLSKFFMTSKLEA